MNSQHHYFVSRPSDGFLSKMGLTSIGPSLVKSVAFCGADPGFKEATGLCSGFEAAAEAKDFPPTICHLGRIRVGLLTSSFDAVATAALLLTQSAKEIQVIFHSYFFERKSQ